MMIRFYLNIQINSYNCLLLMNCIMGIWNICCWCVCLRMLVERKRGVVVYTHQDDHHFFVYFFYKIYFVLRLTLPIQQKESKENERGELKMKKIEMNSFQIIFFSFVFVFVCSQLSINLLFIIHLCYESNQISLYIFVWERCKQK